MSGTDIRCGTAATTSTSTCSELCSGRRSLVVRRSFGAGSTIAQVSTARRVAAAYGDKLSYLGDTGVGRYASAVPGVPRHRRRTIHYDSIGDRIAQGSVVASYARSVVAPYARSVVAPYARSVVAPYASVWCYRILRREGVGRYGGGCTTLSHSKKDTQHRRHLRVAAYPGSVPSIA
eukprot:3940397-Rhodomonas_salina.1